MEIKYYLKMDGREPYQPIHGMLLGPDLSIDNDCVHIYLEWPQGKSASAQNAVLPAKFMTEEKSGRGDIWIPVN